MAQPSSLGFRLLIWFALLGVVPSSVLAVVAYLQLVRADEHYVLGHLRASARDGARAIEARLGEFRGQAALAARHDLGRAGEGLAAFRPVRPGDGEYDIVGPDGVFSGSSGTRPLGPEELEALRRGAPLQDGERIVLGVPLPEGGAAVVRVAADRIFLGLGDDRGLGRTGDTYVVDCEGRILSGNRAREQERQRGTRVDLPETAGTYLDTRGEDVLGASERVGPWRVVSEMERAEVLGPLRDLAVRLLAIGTCMFVIVSIALLYAGRRIDRSVEAMVASLERAARGEFGGVVEGRVPAASAAVKVAIDDMHRRLKERDAQIRDQQRQLVCQRCELERLNAEIVEADRMKREFVANMSHEVRTPLHSILSLSGVLLDETSGELNEEQRRQVGIIERNGSALLRMLGDILDFSKIEAGRMSLFPEEVTPGAALASVREAIAPLARERDLAITLDLPGGLAPLRTDPEKLHRVLLNLAHNAVKFTERGTVTLSARPREDGGIVFVVKDTGSGIPEAEISSIFEPFRQLDGSSTRAIGGTGLGLTIAKSLIELLGGRIGVESAPGRGTTFTAALPPVLPAPEQRAGEAPPGSEAVVVVGATPPRGEALQTALGAAGFRATLALCARDVQEALSRTQARAILLDLEFLDGAGLALFSGLAPRLDRAGVAVLGYRLDDDQEHGTYLGPLRLRRPQEPGGTYAFAGPDGRLVSLPNEVRAADRERAAHWVNGFHEAEQRPLRDVAARLGADLDLYLRPNGNGTAGPRGEWILLVDPDPDARYSMSLQLEQMGYTVHAGADLDTLPHAQGSAISITEARLPDNPDPVPLLRERTGAPVIVVTADARAETHDRARAAGAAAVLVKPVSSSELLRTIETVRAGVGA